MTEFKAIKFDFDQFNLINRCIKRVDRNYLENFSNVLEKCFLFKSFGPSSLNFRSKLNENPKEPNF
ncbi:hypothetical protein BpHYR1_022901 [Brachionus plicatilis]|uniref:Uncharacterized protein n=1 Tax=Brachionus plicatilis TaxID=10195 RepID=A0A3M7QGZ9_BRAPC|nr:hypothetical protein BpHYR1_022901 [Brachionus plicatilis]